MTFITNKLGDVVTRCSSVLNQTYLYYIIFLSKQHTNTFYQNLIGKIIY